MFLIVIVTPDKNKKTFNLEISAIRISNSRLLNLKSKVWNLKSYIAYCKSPVASSRLPVFSVNKPIHCYLVSNNFYFC